MTTGIRVIWPDDARGIDEIEYFYGINVAQLDHIPEFTTVQAFWPGYGSRNPIEYVVDAHCERNRPGEVRLVVTYDPAKNLKIIKIAEECDVEICWGTNTIVLQQRSQNGHCEWLHVGEEDFERIPWEAFDFGAGRARRPRATSRTRREARFREMILACDDHRCVLTGEATTKALDAAHLIPAAMGENDVPSNGITLRADLHRLFDAGLFMFDHDGRVVAIARELSEAYRRLLQNRCLPPSTLERVRATLALPQLQNRPCAP